MKENGVGIGLVSGSSLGALVFALTGSPVWIGLGAALGLMLGVVSVRARGRRDDRLGR